MLPGLRRMNDACVYPHRMQLARSLCIELLSRGVSAPDGEIACICESHRVTIARSAKNDRVECMLIASRRETAARVARGFLKENRLWRTPKILLKGALRAAATRRCYAPLRAVTLGPGNLRGCEKFRVRSRALTRRRATAAPPCALPESPRPCEH